MDLETLADQEMGINFIPQSEYKLVPCLLFLLNLGPIWSCCLDGGQEIGEGHGI